MRKKRERVFSSYPLATKILSFLQLSGEEYPSKILAKRLRIKKSTARRYLFALANEGQILTRKSLGINLYRYPEPISEKLPPVEELVFHNIVLRFHHKYQHSLPKEGRWRESLYLPSTQEIEFSTKSQGVGFVSPGVCVGSVAFQNEGGSLMCYYGGSGRPLSWPEFLAYISFLGKRFGCEPLKDSRWLCSQIALGTDKRKTFAETFRGSVSLHDFVGNVSRIYDKQLKNGQVVIRREHHRARPQETLMAFIESLRGSINTMDALNIVTSTAKRQDEVVRSINLLNRRLDEVSKGQQIVVSVLKELVETLDLNYMKKRPRR